MKAAITATAILIASPALADPGHVAAAHGHSHWFAAAGWALGVDRERIARWLGR